MSSAVLFKLTYKPEVTIQLSASMLYKLRELVVKKKHWPFPLFNLKAFCFNIADLGFHSGWEDNVLIAHAIVKHYLTPEITENLIDTSEITLTGLTYIDYTLSMLKLHYTTCNYLIKVIEQDLLLAQYR